MSLGVLTTAVALGVSDGVVGRGIRAIFGEPADFATDYASKGAFVQAVVSHAVTIGVAFALLGAVILRSREQRPLKAALLAANPVVLALGCLLFRSAIVGTSEEYVGLATCGLVVVFGPLLGVSAMLLGGVLGRRAAGSV